MTANQRIFLNIVATYGRSLFTLVCGLFSARWVLMALGQEDYGLYGVIGSMVIFIGMVNNLLSIAVARFYAVSVGAATVVKNNVRGVAECRQWFSTAVALHTTVPIALMIVGYPLGEYAIRSGLLVIPSERIVTCLWVFRFSCVSCLVGMMTIPFNAMYAAKQYIAELTVYSFITTFLNLIVFCYMVNHPGVWLGRYAAWMAFVSIAPNIIIALRAHALFPECRLVLPEMWSISRIACLIKFAGWQAFGGIGNVCRSQGIAILLNRHAEFGSMRNSSMTVANQVAGQTDMLASAMLGAFQPAIANAYGAKDYARMRTLAFCTCKIGTLLSLLFVIPLVMEISEVLGLWLREPPRYAAGFCLYIFIAHIIDRISSGHMLAVTATGRISGYQAFSGSALLLALPLSIVFLKAEFGIYSIGLALALSSLFCAIGRLWFAYNIVGMSVRFWFRTILMPMAVLMIFSVLLGCLPRYLMPPSLIRIVVTSTVSVAVLVIGAWSILLSNEEREYVRMKFVVLKGKFGFYD